jgi:hypothetical protein
MINRSLANNAIVAALTRQPYIPEVWTRQKPKPKPKPKPSQKTPENAEKRRKRLKSLKMPEPLLTDSDPIQGKPASAPDLHPHGIPEGIRTDHGHDLDPVALVIARVHRDRATKGKSR